MAETNVHIDRHINFKMPDGKNINNGKTKLLQRKKKKFGTFVYKLQLNQRISKGIRTTAMQIRNKTGSSATKHQYKGNANFTG